MKTQISQMIWPMLWWKSCLSYLYFFYLSLFICSTLWSPTYLLVSQPFTSWAASSADYLTSPRKLWYLDLPEPFIIIIIGKQASSRLDQWKRAFRLQTLSIILPAGRPWYRLENVIDRCWQASCHEALNATQAIRTPLLLTSTWHELFLLL